MHVMCYPFRLIDQYSFCAPCQNNAKPSDESNEKFVLKGKESGASVFNSRVFAFIPNMCGIEAIRRCYRFE